MSSTSSSERDIPFVLFDGDCGFCKMWVERWRKLTLGDVEFAPYQEAAKDFPDLEEPSLSRAMHLVETDGQVYRGAHAVFRLLTHSKYRRYRFLLWLYESFPPFAEICDAAYRFTAEHRVFAAKATKWLWGDPSPSAFRRSRWLFLRLLGLTSLVAFLSALVQVHGLIGSEGILPAADFLARASDVLESRGLGDLEIFRRLPTVFWWATSDAALTAVCAAGAVASGLLMLGILPRVMVVCLWALYLSVSVAGQIFLGYQWDALLLETLLLSVWLAPLTLFSSPSSEERVTRPALWLLWFLTFKLMFLSGVVKLLSDDPTWENLTALEFHYWTQPLPTWTAYYADKLPDFVHHVATAGMFGVELFVPFLIFGPRRVRHGAAVALILLQLGIAATGNYGFFNLLSASLCVLLFDDRALRALIPGGSRFWPSVDAPIRNHFLPWWKLVVGGVIFGLLLSLSAQKLEERFTREPSSGIVAELSDFVAPFRSINNYGLFAVMTTQRREIMIEGSHDGETWKRYEFAWKPGSPDARPQFALFHMPRLDWQMWFAALRGCAGNRWFHAFLKRLLEGSDEVEALLEHVPFEDEPPVYLRTPTYQYRFGDDQWWQREPSGPFCPPLTLQDGQLHPVSDL